MGDDIQIGDGARIKDVEENRRESFLVDSIGREGVVVSKLDYTYNVFVRLSWGFLDYIDVPTWRLERTHRSKDAGR